MIAINCLRCPEYKEKNCNGNKMDCLYVKCPRNLGECLVVRYCRETESRLHTVLPRSRISDPGHAPWFSRATGLSRWGYWVQIDLPWVCRLTESVVRFRRPKRLRRG